MSVEIWSTSISGYEEINEESDNLNEEDETAEYFELCSNNSFASLTLNFSNQKALEKESLFRAENYFEVHSPPPELS